MAYRTKLLVVANQTVDSADLLRALADRAAEAPITVTLIVPQDHHTGLATRLRGALDQLHAAGIDAEGMLGDVDPCVAVMEVWDPGKFDEVIVSTLPTGSSRWLKIDLPRRIQRVTDAPVTHVETSPEPVAPVVVAGPRSPGHDRPRTIFGRPPGPFRQPTGPAA